jgi:DNA topoisomerase IA
VVESSIGHIRDLPSSGRRDPGRLRRSGKPWARTGVDVENGFEPLYVVPAEKKAQVKKLKDLLADASELYLATDEDREGEAIAWHLHEVLEPKVPVRRMVFHEITEKAIKHAIATRARSTRSWSTPRRRAASSTASTATRCRRCCGARSRRGCRPAACSRSRPA